MFDPLITPNGLANSVVETDAVKADFILLSHGHQDHIADCVRIATRTGAKIICNAEIEEWLNKQCLTNIHPISAGGKWNFGGFYGKMHGSTTQQRVAGRQLWGQPDGFYHYE